jgi:type II secretory pathway component GspD/PulD (secretin)
VPVLEQTRQAGAIHMIAHCITKREAETSVVLLSSQTLVLGGLIQNKRTSIRTGVPVLHRIPILGFLFGFKEERIEKTELVLVITPRVVGTAVEAARITEEMRRAKVAFVADGQPRLSHSCRKEGVLPTLSPTGPSQPRRHCGPARRLRMRASHSRGVADRQTVIEW